MQEIGGGIGMIDTLLGGIEGVTAAYLVPGERPALVETGARTSAPALRAGLARAGVGPDDLAWIVLTHIHLDHCGGTGIVAAAFPRATVVVHRRGARHLAEPGRLVAASAEVYGRRWALYGGLDRTPADRIVAAEDGHRVPVSPGRDLVLLETTGHARHHMAVHDEATGTVFAGDAAGARLGAGGLYPSLPPPDVRPRRGRSQPRPDRRAGPGAGLPGPFRPRPGPAGDPRGRPGAARPRRRGRGRRGRRARGPGGRGRGGPAAGGHRRRRRRPRALGAARVGGRQRRRPRRVARAAMKEVNVRLVVMSVRDGRLEALLLRLPGSVWALPGAPVGAGATLEDAARRALERQTGMRGIRLEQLYTFDRAGGAGVSVAHLALAPAEGHPLAPGPDVVEVRWFPPGDLPALDPCEAEILEYGRARVRAKAAYAPIALDLLPEAFTLGDLQAVYEAVLDRPLDTRNFRRDVLASGVVEPLDRVRSDGPGRPARLYRSAGGDFQALAPERRIARAIAGADEAP